MTTTSTVYSRLLFWFLSGKRADWLCEWKGSLGGGNVEWVYCGFVESLNFVCGK